MRTALDIPPGQLDQQERDFIRDIEDHGWFDTHVLVGSEGPGFSYSTGFWLKRGFPEVILFSLPRSVSHNVLWNVFRDVEAGRRPPIGLPVNDVFGNADAVFLPVGKTHYAEHLGWARWFYEGDDFPCLQLVWPDPDGKFPWQPGFAESFRECQPDLTENGWLSELAQ